MAVDLFKLQGRVEIDTGKAESDLKRVGKAAQQTQHALTQTDTAGKKAGSGISSGFSQGTASAHKLSSAIGQVQSKLGSLKMPSLNFGGGGGGLGSLVGSLTKANILTNAISSAFSGMTDAMKEGYSAGIEYNSMLEKAQISFTTLLGSSAKATAALKELQAFGEATPFEFPDLIKAEQRMLAMGFAADKIIPTLRNVGDAVSAIGGGKEELDGVVLALGQMQTKGKVSAEEMNQLAERGIPAWDLLAQKVGMTKAQLMKLAEQGKLSGGAAVGLIISAMGEKYGGQMSKMSATREGQMSNLQDIMNRRLGEATSGAFGQEKQAIEAATKGLGTQSADRFVKELNNTMTGIAAGITESMGMVSSGKIFTAGTAGLKLADKAQGAAAGITDRLEGAGIYSPLGILKKTFDPSKEKNESMRTFFQVLQDGVNGALEKLAASGSENGKNVGSAIGTGIKTGTATALDAHSPSRVMMQLGEDAMSGFGIGFNNAVEGEINRNSEGIKKWAKAIAAAGGEEFLKEVERIAANLKIDPNKLMNVMAFESRLDPGKKNPNSSATGLIQFMDSTAESLGTTTAKLQGMNAIEQLKYVEAYFKQFKQLADTQEAVYTAVLAGKPVSDPNAVLFRNAKGKAGAAYRANSALDVDKSGTITAAEAAAQTYKQGFLSMDATATKTSGILDQFSAALDSAKNQLSAFTSSVASYVGLGGATAPAPAVRAVPKVQAVRQAPQTVSGGNLAAVPVQQQQPQTVQGGALGSATATAKADTLTLSADATAAGNAVMKQIPQMTVKTVEAGTAATQTAAAMGTVTKASQEEIKALFDVGDATQKTIDHMAHFRDAFANSFDDLLDGKKFDWKSLAKGLQSSMISSLTGGKATSPGQMLSGALFGYGGNSAGAQGGGSGGGLLGGLLGGGGAGGGVPATGGFAGGGGASDILNSGMNATSMFQKGGALSKLPGLGKVGGLLGKIPGLSKLGSLFGIGGGGGAAAAAAGAEGAGAAAAGGGGLSALLGGGGMAAMFSNPVTAIIGGALIAAPFIAKLFGKNPLNDYKKLVKGEYGVGISDQMASKIMQIGQSKFGQEWQKREIETVRLPEVRDMLAEYSGAFQKGGNSKLFDSRIYSDAFSSVNQFKVGMINGGRVPGPTRGFDHVPVLMDGGEVVISNDQQRRAQRGRGGMFGKGIDEVLERLAAAMDRFEAMPADHVVMTGLAKRPGMAAADVRQDFERRGEHSARIREISASY